MNDFLKKVKEDIQKSGFLTELIVGQKLSKDGWKVEFAQTYRDLDEQISRDIDVIAHKVYDNPDCDLQLVINLVFEVKRGNDRPWVVFMTEDRDPEYRWNILHAGEAYLTQGGAKFTYALSTKDILRSDGKFGTAFDDAFKGEKNAKPRIYEALISATKAAHWKKASWGETKSNAQYQSGSQVVLEFFIPIALTTDKLFEVHLIDREADLREAQWLPVKLHYSSPNYSEGGVQFYPYATTLATLDEFMVVINGWFKKLADNFSTAVERQRNKDKEITNL